MFRRTPKGWRHARSAAGMRLAVGALLVIGPFAGAAVAEERLPWLLQSIEIDQNHPDEVKATADLEVQLLIEKLRQELPRLLPEVRVDLRFGKVDLEKTGDRHEVRLKTQVEGRVKIPADKVEVEVKPDPISIEARVRLQAAGRAAEVELWLERLNVSPVHRSVGTWALPLPALGRWKDVELQDLDVLEVWDDRVTVGVVAKLAQKPQSAAGPRPLEPSAGIGSGGGPEPAAPVQAPPLPAIPVSESAWFNLQPPPPVMLTPMAGPILPEPPPSRLDLPISVPIETLRQFAESNVPREQTEEGYNVHFNGGADNAGHGVSFGYWVQRGPLDLSMQGAALHVSADIKYWVQGRARPPGPIHPLISVSCGKDEAPRRATIGLKTTLTLRSDWTVDAATTPGPVVPRNRCRVTFLNIDVTDHAVGAMRRILDRLAGQLDKRIESALAVRETAEHAWQQISKPIQLDQGIWLDLRPQAIATSPLSTEGGQIVLGLHMEARPRIVLGQAPEVQLVPLPSLGQQSTGDGFHVIVPIEIGYEEATRRLRETLGLPDKPLRYPPGDASLIEIKDVEVSAVGGQVVIRAALGGNAAGWMYLVGKPHYDALTQTLSFPALDYTVETQGALPRPAEGFEPEPVRQGFRASAKIRLQDRIAEWQSRMARVLNRSLGRLELSGTIQSLELIGLAADSEHRRFILQVRMSGRIAAALR